MILLRKLNKQQSGQIMVIVLMIMGLSGLLVVPLLNFMNTGLSAIQIYHEKMDQLYAADAGIQKGIWQIKTSFSSMQGESYSEYLDTFTVNGNDVDVHLGYAWPLNGIVDIVDGPHNAWLAMETRGYADTNGLYTLEMVYKSDVPGNKKVDIIGVWLPNGFEYVPGSSLEFADNIVYAEPLPENIIYAHGGTSILWDVEPNLGFSTYGESATQKFRFTPVGEIPAGDIAWVMSQSNDIGLSWDNYIFNYGLSATATSPSTGKSTTITTHICIDTGDDPDNPGIAIIDYIVE